MMDMITGDKNGSGPAVGIPGGASVSFSVANTKGTNPANVVPNTVQQPQTLQTNVQPVVTDIGGSGDKSGSEKTGSKVGKALGAIGKGVGGLVSIGGFILKILGPALASMSGMQSLMKLASNTLKIIAKPVNSIFKELTKTMRPLFKKIAPMISNILSIVGGLVSDLMPLVTTVASATMSLLPALTPVIKAVTTIISPLIKGLNGLIETVIVPTVQIVAGAVTGLLGGILWLGGSITSGLGKVVGAISKKKGNSIVKFGESVKESGSETMKEAGNLFKSALGPIINKITDAMGGKDTSDENEDTANTGSESKLSRLEVAKKYGLHHIDMAKLADSSKFQESLKSYANVTGYSYDALIEKVRSGDILDNEKILSEMLEYLKMDYKQNLEQNKKVNEHIEFDEDATKKGMLPFVAKMKTRLLPTIDKISNVGDAVYGGLMYAAGMLLSAVSLGFSDTGKQLVEEGKAKISQAMSSGDFTADTPPSTPSKDLVEYAKRQTTSTYTEYTSGPLTEERYQQPISGQTSILDNQGIFYYSSYDDIYGSGDVSQKSFGSFMNMSKRGCGPVALAEAYARRTGSRVNPAQLAKGMARTGAYDPSMGTSVNGFINTGNSMGMGMYAGGVTESSLRSASPHNPITVFGSGPAYGTRKGNNHFMNVIGSDGQGNGYVSNPLTGKTTKRSLNSIARGSSLGLYGSGDDNLEEAKSQIADVKSSMDLSNIADIDSIINDDTKTALSDLKNLANKILSIFELDEGDASAILEQEETMAQIEQNKSVLSDEEKATLEEDAKKLFETENPRVAGDPGETDEEYESRWQKVKNKFLLIASNEKAKKYFTDRAENVKTFTENIAQLFEQSLLSSGSNGSSGGSGGTISSKDGVVLATPYEVTITKPNVRSTNPGETTESPLHEFFKNTIGVPAWSSNGNFFRFRSNPDSMGSGTSGDSHDGIDIQASGSSSNDKPLYATTDGVVTYVAGGITRDRGGMGDNGGGGNYVEWKDVAGNKHRYLHMHNSTPAVSIGDNVIGGKTLMGFMGDTGHSFGHHLHYDIRNTAGSKVNPIEFFSVYTPPTNSSSSNLGNGSDEDKIFRYLISNGANKIGASGFMGAWEWESGNNPSRLEGDRSMGGINSTRVLNAFKSQKAMNEYVKEMVPKYYGGWAGLDHSTYCPDGTNYYPGVGLAQWTGDRTKALAKKAKEMGTQWNDLGTQLSLWKDEVTLNSYLGSALTKANQAGSPAAAAEKVLNIYEGHSSNGKYAYLRERQQFANEFYNRYKNMDPSQDLIDATNASNLDAFIDNNDGTFTVKQGNSTLVSREGYSKEHLQDLMGSGDEYTLDDLLNTNRFNDTFDTSLIDTSIPESDGNNQPIIVNRYITYDEGKNDERLKMILSNTYNVRARRVEELLEEIIEKMDDNDDKPKPTGGSGTRNTTPSNMFDENGIPKALQRLYTE
ncbi:MAG: peptidoglycan DD-metalloendopeptidase family protein [Clostridia bacterium]|nr:peptidoglycan DD-metalloendopeptidase family protein [Clostridia bacterium]